MSNENNNNKSLGYAVKLNTKSISMKDIKARASKSPSAPSPGKAPGPSAESVESFFASENIVPPLPSTSVSSMSSKPSASAAASPGTAASPVPAEFGSLAGRLYSEIDRSVEKKRAEKNANAELEDESSELESKFLLMSPLSKNIIIKTILGAVIVWLGYSIYSNNIQEHPFEYEDSFFPISQDRREYRRAAVYIDFIVKLVDEKGSPGIRNKWLKKIPPQFSEFAGSKITDLAVDGYEVLSVSANNDTPRIYKVKCLCKEGGTVFFEIIKIKYGGEIIFRLLKVY